MLAEYGLTEEQGNEIIMAARAHWFEDEDAAATGEDAVAEQAAMIRLDGQSRVRRASGPAS